MHRVVVCILFLLSRAASALLDPPCDHFLSCNVSNHTCCAARAAANRVAHAQKAVMFRYSPVLHPGSPGSEACDDVTQFQHIFDAACSFPWWPHAYHRIINCLLPQSALLAAAETAGTGAVSLVPTYTLDFVLALFSLAKVVPVNMGTIWAGQEPARTCFRASPSALVHNEVEADSWDWLGGMNLYDHSQAHPCSVPEGLELQRRGAEVLSRVRSREGAAKNASAAALLPAAYALVIDRHSGEREWCNSSVVFAAAAAAWPALSIVAYHGNASAVDTIAAFSGASVILGYHGAAFANLLFAGRGSTAIEVALATHNGCMYRSNLLALSSVLSAAGVRPIGYALPVLDGLPAAEADEVRARFALADPADGLLHSKLCVAVAPAALVDVLRAAHPAPAGGEPRPFSTCP